MTRAIVTNPIDGGRVHPTEDPLEALVEACVHSSKDSAEAADDAWIYGIVVGWDDDPADEDRPSGINALDEVAAMHGWTPEQCDRLRRLHHAYRALARKDEVRAALAEAARQSARADKAEAALAALVLPQAFPTAPEADRG